MSKISTHVLDTSRGRPASGVEVQLFRGDTLVSVARTNQDGRIANLLPEAIPLETGVYRLTFAVDGYSGQQSFYPEVSITFRVTDAGAHHHVPLLLSPFGYTTYRGS